MPQHVLRRVGAAALNRRFRGRRGLRPVVAPPSMPVPSVLDVARFPVPVALPQDCGIPSGWEDSFPAPPAASARLTCNMARTRGMQYTGQGPALQSRQEGTPVGDKDRKSPDLTFVAPSHRSNPERQSGTRGGMSWRGTASPPPSGGRDGVPAGKDLDGQRQRLLQGAIRPEHIHLAADQYANRPSNTRRGWYALMKRLNHGDPDGHRWSLRRWPSWARR